VSVIMLAAMWNVLLALAPWLLLGAGISGLMHGLLPPGFVSHNLRGKLGVLKAVGIGIPLPLCSCGVIPAALGLKRQGASSGAAVGFLIATPQTGVDSIFVSGSFLGWPFALFKVAAAVVTGVLGGLLTDAVDSRDSEPAALACAREESAKTRRDLRGMVEHSLELLRTIWVWVAVGVVVSAAIELVVPPGYLSGLGSYGRWGALLVTLAIAAPLYVCATASVPIAAALVVAGMPPGAALVFLIAGPATNVATIGAVYRALGARALGAYLGSIVGGSLLAGLVFDSLLPQSAVTAIHHHHEAAWWAVTSAVVVLGLLGWFAVDDARHWLGHQRARARGESTIEVPVFGMTCSGCAARLERSLGRADGVLSAVVTLESGKAVVRGRTSESRVRELIEQAGLRAG
jgi:uncharacterized membrane protein YraQ (UPF0718 family)/copper chaperone CopZ